MTDFWKGRPVFVTGGFGFVGANLTASLVDRGANVVCMQRDEASPNSLDLLGLRERVTVVNGDLLDYALLSRILNEYEIDAVFHLAAQAIVGAANRSPVPTFETNIRGTYLLLEACRLNSSVKRIVIASSDKAYGSHNELPYREDFALQGVFPYDVSKSCTDLISRSFAVTYQMPVAITRSANIYGPADINLSRIIPGTIVSALKGEDPVIRSDGTPLREFVYVSDVCDAYLLLAQKIEGFQGEAFNIGADEPVQILELTNRIIDLAGKKEFVRPNILLKDKIQHEIDAQYLSGDKIEQTLGWRPSVNLDEGLRKSIEWYNQNLERLVG